MDQNLKLNIEDYLDATSDAAKRTRTVIIIIVVASVLTFAGFLNSLEHNWMLQRVRAAAVPQSDYVKQKFPDIKDQEALNKCQDVFYGALMKAYVDNTYTIRVPFFGITFDVNDLALLGGLAFIILLILFRFSLAREHDNLVISFEEAKNDRQLATFYDLLAMRQVLTTPPMQGRNTVASLMIIPKVLSVLPLIILSVIIAHDFMTYNVGAAINVWHTVLLYIVSSALWAFILILTISCLLVWLKTDAVWRKTWQEVQATKTIKLAPRIEPATAPQGQDTH